MSKFTTARAEQYANIADIQAWANQVMERVPDFVIGDNYLRRWWVIPRSEFCNVYLHEIWKSDSDEAMHDHPWDSTSVLIDGSYVEHTPEERHLRSAGDVVQRLATDRHRLEIPEGGRAVSLFITGPKVREWGFWCPKGFVHWKDFVDGSNTGRGGKGCA